MLDGLIISILSLTKHAQEPLRIFILTGALQNRHRQFHALTDEHAALLDRVAKRKNPAHSVVKIDMTLYLTPTHQRQMLIRCLRRIVCCGCTVT